MLFPELLYELSPRDQKLTPLEIVTHYGTITSANINHDHFYNVPVDKVFLMHNYSLEIITPLLQTITAAALELFRDVIQITPNAVIERFTSSDGFSGDEIGITTTSGKDIAFHGIAQVIAPPGAILRFRVSYIAPIANTTSSVSLMGLLIPRGNFAF